MHRFFKNAFKKVASYIAIGSLVLFSITFKKIRIGRLLYQRMGHFCGDFLLFEAENRFTKNKMINLFVYDGEPANVQWEKIFLRNAKVIPRWLNRFIDFSFIKKVKPDMLLPTHFNGSTRDISGLIQMVGPRKWLFEKENQKVTQLLIERGWSGEPIITLHVRDSGYLESNHLHKGAISGTWSYHNYRNSNISNYLYTVENLVKDGYFVCRIGKNPEKRLPYKNPKFIDCWFDNLQEDLVDIWLCLNSKLLISTASGIDVLAAYSGVPVCFVNAMPLKEAWTFSDCLWVPKNCFWKQTGEHLSFVEMINHSYHYSGQYEAANVFIEELSPQEINIAVQESLARIDGRFAASNIQKKIKSEYEKILRALPDFDKQFGFIHPNFSFGLNWMQSKGDDFLSTGF